MTIAAKKTLSMPQRGRLHLSRAPGESVFIYPKAQSMSEPAQNLFSTPLSIRIEYIEPNAAQLQISANRGLVVVRDEIFQRNQFFEPRDNSADDSVRRVFFELAKKTLDEATFHLLLQTAIHQCR